MLKVQIINNASKQFRWYLGWYTSGRHPVSTWSPLGVAFNALPAKKLNLGLFKEDTGLFGVDQLSSPTGFYAMKDIAVLDAQKLSKEACSVNRKRKVVDIFDEMSDALCRVADLAEFVRIAHPKAAYRQAAEDATYDISTIVEQLNTNRPLYDSLRHVVENGDILPTTEVDELVAKLFLFDFEQSGIHFPEETREKVVSLTSSIMTLGQHFMMGASQQRTMSKSLLPSRLRSHFANDGDNVVVGSLQSDCSDEKVREAAYKLYLAPDKHQEYLLQELLNSRRKLAETCGFPSYAHRATRGTTAETPEFVGQFLDVLNTQLRPLVQDELKILLRLKQSEDPSATVVQPWDLSYLTTKAKQEFLQIGFIDVGDYFCLGACMEGLNHLTQSLFGISLRYEEVDSKEVWAPDVYKLAVEHETEGLLGYIYCDFYRRSGKPQQDCHFTIRGGRERADGTYQNPIVVLMLNLNAPRWSGPCLLSPGQLDNLAHEMGHALHSMLARTKHQHVTGTRCATDFAEVPSILMEYFLADHRVLRTFAKHFQTKEPMPDDVVHKLCQSKSLFSAIETQNQVLYSALDQTLHAEALPDSSTSHIFNSLQGTYSVLPPVENTGWQLRFSHLVGYGARYYSYLFSRSVASCIWQSYFAENPFSREAGERYRRHCLSHGGGKPPRLVLRDFLQQEVRPHLMAEALVAEITQQQDKSKVVF